MLLSARGDRFLLLSSTRTVIKERALPSATMVFLSASSDNCADSPAVLTASSAQGLPFLYVNTFNSPGSYTTLSQRKRYSYCPLFFLPSDFLFRNNSASSAEEKTCTGVICPTRSGQVQCGNIC